MDHAWNVVLEDGKLKHIDISYAIMNRNSKNKMNYFMKSFAELQQVCGSRTMNQNESELIDELTHKIKVINRTDVKKFRVVNSFDDLEDNNRRKKQIDKINKDNKDNIDNIDNIDNCIIVFEKIVLYKHDGKKYDFCYNTLTDSAKEIYDELFKIQSDYIK